MEKRLININETAEYLGITKGTLYVWVFQRRIPFIKIGRLTKFDIKEIDKWIDGNRVKVNSFDMSKLP